MEIAIQNYHGYTLEPCAFTDQNNQRIYAQFQLPEGAILGYKDFYSGRVFDNPQRGCHEVVVLFEGAGEIRNEPKDWIKPEGAASLNTHWSILPALKNFFFSQLPREGDPEEWQFSLENISGINPMKYIKDEGFKYGCKMDNWMSRFSQNLPQNEFFQLEIKRGGTGAYASNDRIYFRLK